MTTAFHMPGLVNPGPAPRPQGVEHPTFMARVLPNRYIVVNAPAAAKDALKEAGCRFNEPVAPWKWSIPATPFVARRLRKYLRGIAGDAQFRSLLDQAVVVDFKTVDLSTLPQPRGLKHSLWEHQLRCYGLLKQFPGANLHLDMGGGKTLPTWARIVDLALDGGRRFLIVTTDKAVPVWAREFTKHIDPALNKMFHIVTLSGGVPRKTKQAQDGAAYADAHGMALVIVTNYDSLWRFPLGPKLKVVEETNERTGKKYKKTVIEEPGFVLSQQWDAAVADEIHLISNPEAKRSQMMYMVRDRAANRYGLTGTPHTKDVLAPFGQMLFVEPGLLGTNFYEFRERFALLDEYNSVITTRNEELLQQLLNYVSIRYMLTEVRPDMPEQVVSEVFATLPPEIMRSYMELRNEMYTEIWTADDKGVRIETQNVLEKILRLAQLAGGHAGRTETVEVDGVPRKVSSVTHVHSAKEEVLAEWLDDIQPDQPAVIFVRFRPEIKRLRQIVALTGRQAYELSGEKNEWLDWMADQDVHNPALWPDGKAPVMIAQIDSGAAGIDFTRCNGRFVYYLCYYSIGNRRVMYVQSRGRIFRPGADTRKGTKQYVTHILAQNTIDEDIVAALEAQTEIIDWVLDKIRRERKPRRKKAA